MHTSENPSSFRRLAVAAAAAAFCAAAYAGPRVTVIGDSYSTYAGTMPAGFVTCYDGSYNGVASVGQTYWMRIINALGGTLEINNSWSGSWVCNANNTLGVPSFVSPERLAMLGDPDLFIVCGGSNDCWWGDLYGLMKGKNPLGEFVYSGWTTEQLMQFRPAFAYLLDYLTTNFPSAKILVVVNSTDDANSAWALTEDYASSMETIAANYSAMCVRCHDVEKLDYHPTPAGCQTMASQALAVLEANLPAGWTATSDAFVSSSEKLRSPVSGVYVADTVGPGTITAKKDLVLSRMVLVGGGGAGGGTLGGGGGGGAVVDITFAEPVEIDSGAVVSYEIGAGGTAAQSATAPGGNGAATRVTVGSVEYTAPGGGGGGGWGGGTDGAADVANQTGRDGANGGGGAFKRQGGQPLSASGFAGGASSGSGEADYGGGGGGGAGGAGADGSDSKAGDGGIGVSLSVTGASLDYGSGGGAGAGNAAAGLGLAGGPGAGAGGPSAGHGGAGGAALGGRGGGGGGGGFITDGSGYHFYSGGNGGSGSVILVLEPLVEGVDPKPLPPALLSREKTSATFAFTLHRLGLNAQTHQLYAVVSNQLTEAVSTNLAWSGSATADTPVEVEVTGLAAGVRYTVFAYCENDVGGRALSGGTAFRTKVEPATDYYVSEISFPGAPAASAGAVVVPIRLAENHPEGFSYTDCPDPDLLRFTSSEGDELAFDVDTWDGSGTSLVWVKVPSLSSSTKIIAKWFPNDDAFERDLASADVWTGYLSVWHLSEDGTDAPQPDATGSAHALSGRNGTVASAGKFGLARTINDLDYSSLHDGGTYASARSGRVLVAADYADDSVFSAPFTISFWAKHRQGVAPFYDSFVSQKQRGDNMWYAGGFHFQLWDGDYQYDAKDSANTESTGSFAAALSSGAWIHYALVVGSGTLDVYENGSPVGHVANFSYSAPGLPLAFGAPPAGERDMSFNGAFDEIRVASAALSAAQVSAAYAAMASDSYARLGRARHIGAEEPVPASGPVYPHYEATLAFPKAGAAEVPDVPVLVRIAEGSPAGFSYADCRSLVFRDSDGTELPHDVDTWNPDGTSLVWVTVPALSSATEIVMEWYRFSGRSKTDSTGTWSEYRSVWHLSEPGENAVHADASGNSRTLAGTGGTVEAVGMVGSGRTIADLSDWTQISSGALNNGHGLVASGYATEGSLPAPFTISLWARHRKDVDVFFSNIFSRRIGNSGSYAQLWWGKDAEPNYSQLIKIDGAYNVYSAAPFPDGEWRYLTFAVGADSTLDFYENGVLRQHITGYSYADNANPLVFGNKADLGDMAWNGEMDEIRVASDKRTAAQIAAEYLTVTDAGYVSFGEVRFIPGTIGFQFLAR